MNELEQYIQTECYELVIASLNKFKFPRQSAKYELQLDLLQAEDTSKHQILSDYLSSKAVCLSLNLRNQIEERFDLNLIKAPFNTVTRQALLEELTVFVKKEYGGYKDMNINKEKYLTANKIAEVFQDYMINDYIPTMDIDVRNTNIGSLLVKRNNPKL